MTGISTWTRSLVREFQWIQVWHTLNQMDPLGRSHTHPRSHGPSATTLCTTL